MKIKDLITFLESKCPPAYQESYDNCGLITGSPEHEINGVLICLDSTKAVLHEAIKHKCNFIIAHHPILFSPIKKLTGKTYSERVLINAVKHDIAIYAMHTNLDNIYHGVNRKIAEKLGLKDLTILSPKNGLLRKLVTFCPRDKADEVRTAIFAAGAGVIGDYDQCSFNAQGIGSFRAGKDTNPYAGSKGIRHYENEERIETILPAHLESAIVRALMSSHPYEEVAFDIYPLDNAHPQVGSGMLGSLAKPLKEKNFLEMVKEKMQLSCLRHSPFTGNKIEKVALCGGSGSFLLPNARKAGAQALVTADFKYHQFFDAEGEILIADIGHYESERFTPEIVYSLLKEKFPTFAVQISKTNTNPVNYL